MKLIYNSNLEQVRIDKIYTNPNDLTIYTEVEIPFINITNIKADIRIESDTYVILETEKLLIDIPIIVECKMVGMIDYNDLRKYLIINVLPNWDLLSDIEKSQLKSYYIVPSNYTWGSEQSVFYKILVDNATKCRETRIDQGRSYVSLFYIADVQKSMDFFIDTELLMNQYIKGKIPALEAFINDDNIAGFDYRTNGFSTKSYYDQEGIIKDQLNYLLFR